MYSTMAFHGQRQRVVDGLSAGDIALDPTRPFTERVCCESQDIGSSTGDGEELLDAPD